MSWFLIFDDDDNNEYDLRVQSNIVKSAVFVRLAFLEKIDLSLILSGEKRRSKSHDQVE